MYLIGYLFTNISEDYFLQKSNYKNCMAYAPFILQFSVWKTATMRAINHAVIHKCVFIKFL